MERKFNRNLTATSSWLATDGGQALGLHTNEAYHVFKTMERVGWWLSAERLHRERSQELVTFTTGSQ